MYLELKNYELLREAVTAISSRSESSKSCSVVSNNTHKQMKKQINKFQNNDCRAPLCCG